MGELPSVGGRLLTRRSPSEAGPEAELVAEPVAEPMAEPTAEPAADFGVPAAALPPSLSWWGGQFSRGR